MRQHFEEIEQLTQLLNDEVGHSRLMQMLINEKIEKRALIAKFAEHEFKVKLDETQREKNIRNNIS